MCNHCVSQKEHKQRIAGILENGLTTASKIAAEIGVSERSVYRYISAMRREGVNIGGAAGLGYMLRAPRRQGQAQP